MDEKRDREIRWKNCYFCHFLSFECTRVQVYKLASLQENEEWREAMMIEKVLLLSPFLIKLLIESIFYVMKIVTKKL
jgi:hypothetical protein